MMKNLPGLRPGPADPRPGTGCARGGLPYGCMGKDKEEEEEIEEYVAEPEAVAA